MGDRYTLLDVIGRGATGVVHRAEDRQHPGRIVAVKRVEGGQVRDALRVEADALARLAHPSIVRILDVVTDDDGASLVTPFLPGGTLAERLAARGPLPAADVADLGARLGDALAAAHDAGVVHRDVKPANVLFDAEEQPLLADFGAALLDGRADGWVVGTATSIDPAVVVDGAPHGPEADQYGLAATLYEALAGVPPYAAGTAEATVRAADRAVRVPLAQHAPEAPEALCAAIEQALSRDPAGRFGTVRDLATRCAEARTRLAAAPPPGPDVPPGPDAPPADEAPVTPPPPPPVSAIPTTPAAPSPPAPTPPNTTTPPSGRDDAAWGLPPLEVPADATTRFGPAPPSRPAPVVDEPRSRVRPGVLALAILVLLVPIGVLVAFALGGDGDAPDPGPRPLGDARVDPPRCDDAPAAPDAPEVVLADLDGRGCGIPLGWDPQAAVLTVPGDGDDEQRFAVGEAGDLLVVGSWTCDGVDAPALYRPSTGQVFEFERFGAGDAELTSRPARDTGTTGGTPRVVRGQDGCDRVQIHDGAT